MSTPSRSATSVASLSFILRAERMDASLVSGVAQVLRRVAPLASTSGLTRYDDLVARRTSRFGLCFSRFTGLFGVLFSVAAWFNLYSLAALRMSGGVGERGIPAALGAHGIHLVALLGRQQLVLTASGFIVGLAALVLGRAPRAVFRGDLALAGLGGRTGRCGGLRVRSPGSAPAGCPGRDVRIDAGLQTVALGAGARGAAPAVNNQGRYSMKVMVATQGWLDWRRRSSELPKRCSDAVMRRCSSRRRVFAG